MKIAFIVLELTDTCLFSGWLVVENTTVLFAFSYRAVIATTGPVAQSAIFLELGKYFFINSSRVLVLYFSVVNNLKNKKM